MDVGCTHCSGIFGFEFQCRFVSCQKPGEHRIIVHHQRNHLSGEQRADIRHNASLVQFDAPRRHKIIGFGKFSKKGAKINISHLLREHLFGSRHQGALIADRLGTLLAPQHQSRDREQAGHKPCSKLTAKIGDNDAARSDNGRQHEGVIIGRRIMVEEKCEQRREQSRQGNALIERKRRSQQRTRKNDNHSR